MPPAGYTAEEIARRGRELYEREIREKVESEHPGKFLVVDITTGEYEIDEEDLAASDRLLARNPDAVLYGLRIGQRVAYRIGASVGIVSGSDLWQ
ncbi:hypothetical protein E0L93_00265 [Rubrobacter taiwanensis]|jgi:hypothetical protein|uniref:Uncharacterized protein n=1 Tax=Rubrobacter taiwanensis TaxID=185139 RepID=A0A4R1BSP7_9ACTN|nr:hypothetical protein [Rubrobacter taiwanensis]TCJ20701.1 hypothetical protein E0L93_00265 [Rubrobacter taiwanensis]